MPALARRALALSVLAAFGGAASAAPPSTVAVPLPPPPPGTTLTRPAAARMVLVAAKAGLASPLGNGGEGGPMLQIEAATPWRTTSSGVALAWALPLRTMFLGTTQRAGLEFGGNALELTPTARASFPLGLSRVSFRTEAGIGVVSRWTWAQVDTQFLGRRTETAHTTSAIVRMGLGIDWAVNPRVSIALEPLSLGFDFDGNADWIFGGGVAYRL